MEQLLTPDEAATFLGLCTKSVLRHVAKGNIPALRLGQRTIRISRSVVEQMMKTEKSVEYAVTDE
jgi:excisionase family DNA binding protein